MDFVLCWLDYQITLRWIWGVNKEFKTFVQNRVVEIRRLFPRSGNTVLQNPIQLTFALVDQWLPNLLPIRCGGTVLISFSRDHFAQ